MKGTSADWDARYGAADGGLFGEAPTVWLRAIVGRPDFSARSMLLLADGDGRNGTWVAQQGMAVTGVDLSAEGTRRARLRDTRAAVAVERIVADLRHWQPEPTRRWEAAAVQFLQGPEIVRKRAISLAMERLAPGGWLLVEGFALAQAGEAMGPTDPSRLYDLDQLDAMIPERWHRIEALTGRVALDEGARHHGLAHIVRLAARAPA